jgi:GxxExxY protein
MENAIARQIIGAAIEVHKILGGPGLLESIYEEALFHELMMQGLQCQRQLAVPVKYKNIIIRDPLFLDIQVENKVIIEVKATEEDHPIHQTQLLTYLRLSGIKLGILLNFGKKQMKEGVTRVVNGLQIASAI